MKHPWIALTGAILLLTTACGSDPLLPDEEFRASVLENTTMSIDVDLLGVDGEAHPARIYYNEAGAQRAMFIATHAFIATSDDAVQGRHPAGTLESIADVDMSPLGDAPYSLDVAKPYVYVQIAREPGAKIGWAVPWHVSIEGDVAQPEAPSDTGPSYGALASEPWSVWASSSGQVYNFSNSGCTQTAHAYGLANYLSATGSVTLRRNVTDTGPTQTNIGPSDEVSVAREDPPSGEWSIRAVRTGGFGSQFIASGTFYCIN